MTESKSYDVAVVGTGPAGSTAAYELSRAGVSVVAFEKRSHPRDKICGGGLSARIERILNPRFKDAVERTIHSVRFVCDGRDPFVINSNDPIAYMVMRDRFDHLLVEQAREAGSEVREEEAALDVRRVSDGFDVVTDRRAYRAKVLIGADGANSMVARRLFPDRPLRRIPALESEIDLRKEHRYPGEQTALIDVGAIDRGYAWIFPKQNRLSVGIGTFNGCASNLKEVFRRFCKGDRCLTSLEVPAPHGYPLPLCTVSGSGPDYRLVTDRALLAGDAGHLVDPLFGEGIYHAVRSGQLAAAAVREFLAGKGDLENYEQAIRRELYPEFHVASRMAAVIYRFPRLCYRLMRPYSNVVQLYCGVLQGTETYQTFLAKAKGLVAGSVLDRLRRKRAQSS